MTDLVAFIRARLDEREAAAKAARRGDGRWEYRDRSDDPETFPWTVWAPDVRLSAGTGFAPQEAQFIALNDPKFVLADVAAKRRIMSRHRRYGEVEPSYAPWDDACDGCGFPGDPEWPATEHINDCPELRDLAAPFDQHPDYDPAWAS